MAGPEFHILPNRKAYDALPAWCVFPDGWKGNQEDHRYYGMGTQLAQVFRSGEVGLGSDPAALSAARKTYSKTADGIIYDRWTPHHIIAARLGMRDRVIPNVVKAGTQQPGHAPGLHELSGKPGPGWR